MNTAVMFSNKSDEWETPDEVFLPLDKEFRFKVDVAASHHNSRCPMWFGGQYAIDPDALQVPRWLNHGEAAWMNPPYSQCREFIAKAVEQQALGVTTVALVPARTDTKWWHEYVWDENSNTPRAGVEIRFVKGRIKFKGATAGAPFPSVVIVFRGFL